MEYQINDIIVFNDNGINKTGNIEDIRNDTAFIKGNDAKYYNCKIDNIIKSVGRTLRRTSFSDVQGKGYGRPELENSKEFEKWKQNGYK